MEDVAVFGMSAGGESALDIEVFTNAFQPSFPILPETNNTYGQYQQTGATSPFPLDYIIDQTGRVAYFSTEYEPEAMVAIIDELLAHPAPVGDTPAVFAQLQVAARPNPFNPRTMITFSLPQAGNVKVDIHDMRGRLVRRLVVDQAYPAGDSTVLWDGTDDTGHSLASGLYLMHVRSAGSSVTGKLTLVR